MAKLTNAQLTAQLEAAHASYEKLAAQHEALRANNEELRAEIDSLREQRDSLRTQCEAAELREADMANLMEYAAGTQALWINVEHEEFMRVMREELKPRARAWTAAPDDLVARRAAMAAAKAEAARTGRSVRAW